MRSHTSQVSLSLQVMVNDPRDIGIQLGNGRHCQGGCILTIDKLIK